MCRRTVVVVVVVGRGRRSTCDVEEAFDVASIVVRVGRRWNGYFGIKISLDRPEATFRLMVIVVDTLQFIHQYLPDREIVP